MDAFLGILLKIFKSPIIESNHIFMQWVLLKKQMGYSDYSMT